MTSFAPSAISPGTLSRLVSLYPATVRNVFRSKMIQKGNRVTKGAAKRLRLNTANPEEAEATAIRMARASADPTVPHPNVEKEVEKFYKLDVWRYETLPAMLTERRDAEEPVGHLARRVNWFTKKDPKKEKNKRKAAAEQGVDPVEEQKEEDLANIFLDKEDLVRLVEWKGQHGHTRPSLLGMVKTNPAPHVRFVTRAAFNALPDPSTSPGASPSKSIKILSDDLRGVGPATASLILSLAARATAKTEGTIGADIPFFSDELYVWLRGGVYPSSVAEEDEPGRQKPIRYTPAEYDRLFALATMLKERLNARLTAQSDKTAQPDADKGEQLLSFISMQDIEKAAFVIGNIHISGFYGQSSASKEDPDGPPASSSAEEEEVAEDISTGTVGEKRKRDDQDA